MLLDRGIRLDQTIPIWQGVWRMVSLAGAEALDDMIELACRLRWRKVGEPLGEFAADLEMLVVDRIMPVTAPDQETLVGKQSDHHLGHPGSFAHPVEIVRAGRRVYPHRGVRAHQEWILHGVEIDRETVGVKRTRGTAADVSIV